VGEPHEDPSSELLNIGGFISDNHIWIFWVSYWQYGMYLCFNADTYIH